MIWQYIVYGWLAACTVGLFAYRLGRVAGQRQGKRDARVQVPVQMRIRALQTGTCPVCGNRSSNVLKCGKEG
ncbi:hypothetical protein LLE49_19770 [Alicyclobacillus tolerans]|uniref:hypothetical protein n=1 Tax=Alicyclobacillus tolerans TaxID=90970 RepID=UPI001F3A90B8|nr:hypothetical protein [Alicyclobacillus tolerans]MCF8566962.1 hypothetical protein [Alicyclobacillus tolerans]